jgi:SagB-type dehydrogenase family enzyme
MYIPPTGGVMAQEHESIPLPEITISGKPFLQQLLQQRRSVRDFHHVSLGLSDIGQLLWAAQGITHPQGFRTAPSAGALYPLELYVVAGQVKNLPLGIYHYDPNHHRLIKVGSGDRRKELARAAWRRPWLSDAATVVVFAAVYERTTLKYGKRGARYVHIETGHATQNLFLQAESLGLDTVIVGAFDDDEVKAVLQLPDEVQPLILMPVGKKPEIDKED